MKSKNVVATLSTILLEALAKSIALGQSLTDLHTIEMLATLAIIAKLFQ